MKKSLWLTPPSVWSSMPISRVGMLLVANVGLTVFLAAIVNIWVDEAYSLETASQGVGHALHQALHFELQAPLYFMLLSVWRSLNDSIFFARLLSIGCSALTIYTTVALCRRYLPTVHPLWVVPLVAFHPYLIASAINIRTYALALLLSNVLLLFLYDGYLTPNPKPIAKFGYGVTAILALYTHYFLACGLVAHGLTLLVLRRWRSLGQYVLSMVPVGLMTLPLALVILQQLTTVQTTYAAEADTFTQGLRAAIGRLLDFLLSQIDLRHDLASKVLRLMVAIGLLGIGYAYRRLLTAAHLTLGVLLLSSVLSLALILDVTNTSNIAFRYSYPLLMPVILGSVAALSVIPERRWRTRFLAGWLGLSLCLSSATLVQTYRHLALEGDWKRVGQYLMTQESPNQPILVYFGDSILPLTHYYSGINPLVPLPIDLSWNNYDLTSLILNDEQQIVDRLAQLQNPDQIWLVQGPSFIGTDSRGDCQILEMEFNCHLLQRYAQQHYQVEQERNFYGSNVQLLRRLRQPEA